MIKLKIFCLLATMWLIVGGCNKNKCGKAGPGLESAVLRLGIENADGTDYLASHPNVNPKTCVVYKEDGSYANMYGGGSWEEMKDISSLSSALPIEYIGQYEPVDVEITKIFYVKLDKDMDTLKVVFRQKNLCFELDSFQAYYNGVPVGGNPPYAPRVRKK